MSAYQIDYSEPLRPSFSIPAGGLNGPGATASNSTLRLYGRGALEWGEAVDEDLLRLSENFAAASPPTSANTGQLWVETSLYYHNTSSGTTAGWYRWNFATNSWSLLNGSGSVASVKPTIPSIGQYWYGSDTYDGVVQTTLWGYYNLGRYEPAKWLPRSFMEQAGAPAGTLIPEQKMRVRDGNYLTPGNTRGSWTVPSTTAVSENPPTPPQVGMLWYQPTTGILRVYSSDTSASGLLRWHDVLGPSKTGAVGPIANGPFSMKDPNTSVLYKITDLATPTNANDAVNKTYMDTQLAAGLALKVSKSGDTMTGALVVQSSVTANSLQVNGAATISGLLTASSGANFGSTLSMGNNKITSLATPTAGSDAANKSYVDAAVSSGSSGLNNKYDKTGGPISGNVQISGTLQVTGTTTTSSSIILSGGSSQVTLPNAPLAATDACNKAYVDSIVGGTSSTPPGTVVAFAGQTVPGGWVACEGQELNRTGTFADLFAAIGGGFGTGNGSTTFNVPDLRGQFIRGWSNGSAVDPGRGFGTSQGSQIERHKHVETYSEAIGLPASFGQSPVGGQYGQGRGDNDNAHYYSNDASDIPALGVNAGGPNWNRAGLIGNETRPVNIAMRYIIKY